MPNGSKDLFGGQLKNKTFHSQAFPYWLSKAEAKRKSSTYSVSAGQNAMMELSTRVPNERHSDPRPIHTVLAKCAFSPNQQGTSCILLNSVEPRVMPRFTCKIKRSEERT